MSANRGDPLAGVACSRFGGVVLRRIALLQHTSRLTAKLVRTKKRYC